MISSWGGLSADVADILAPTDAAKMTLPTFPFLPIGLGRSYGDTALPGDVAISLQHLNRILTFDPETGKIQAEAGISLAEILDHIMGQGWFLPVLPGTRFVTLGGAIANDIHGKNHHVAGTFGMHVSSLDLLRSDGTLHACSPSQNGELFAATIGGMGLTGVILRAEIQLMRVSSPAIQQERIRFGHLADFFALNEETGDSYDYSVAWLDSLASGKNLGRGVFLRGNHATKSTQQAKLKTTQIAFPFRPPVSLINRMTLKVFNALYRGLPWPARRSSIVEPESFFFPLDKISNWNRAYGLKGLRQFQCVIPKAIAPQVVRTLLETTQSAGHASFLTVLKMFGPARSPGILSFPREGATLTLDFPYRGAETDQLLAQLDEITLNAGGAVNPYKDARMSRQVFERSFPNWQSMIQHLDPNIGSQFSNRIGMTSRHNRAERR
jgi:FAD/FMN-containing dehydrogenase